MDNIINIENLSFFYDKGINVLKKVSAKFTKNQIIGIFGPNGCGKTTLLKCISNIYKSYEGDITINEKSLKNLNPLETSKILSYVPQEHSISFPYTVYEMVLMGRNPKMNMMSVISDKDIEICQRAMESTGIMDIAFKPYINLSGGQRQLVLITRAIAQETPVVILDEPTSALDFKNKLNVWEILNELKENGKTIIVCTHEPNHIVWFCDNVLVMKNGEVVSFGKVKEIMNMDTLNTLYGDICSISESGIFPKIKKNRQ